MRKFGTKKILFSLFTLVLVIWLKIGLINNRVNPLKKQEQFVIFDPYKLFDECNKNISFSNIRETCHRVFSDESFFNSPSEPLISLSIHELFNPAQGLEDRPIIDPDYAQAYIKRDIVNPYRVISMSVFGQNRRYTRGIIRNAIIIYTGLVFKGWKLRVYYDDSIPNQVTHILKALNVELFRIERVTHEKYDVSGTFWRFMILLDKEVTRYIIRDSDAKLSERDESAVNEWINYGPPFYFHIQRDHPWHAHHILGGMWGSTGGFINANSKHLFASLPMKDIEEGTVSEKYADQDWLRDVIWPNIQKYVLTHDSYKCMDYGSTKSLGYPQKRVDLHDFVGNVYDTSNDFKGMSIPESEISPENCRREKSHLYG